uniref:Uncharacterized protein n=1 Tax=Arundo donax TaxID=35708 RepID=A0A0A9BIY8_ARUDO
MPPPAASPGATWWPGAGVVRGGGWAPSARTWRRGPGR